MNEQNKILRINKVRKAILIAISLVCVIFSLFIFGVKMLKNKNNKEKEKIAYYNYEKQIIVDCNKEL